MKKLTDEQKEALALFKERRGGVPDDLKKRFASLKAVRKKIRGVLENKPSTIPDIVKTLGVDSAEILWNLMGMRKYGEVRDAGEEGDYILYELIKKEE